MATSVHSISIELLDDYTGSFEYDETMCLQFDMASNKVIVNLNTKTIYMQLQDNLDNLMTDEEEKNLSQILAIVQQESIKKLEINYTKVKVFNSSAMRRMFRFIYKFTAINHQKCTINFYYNQNENWQKKHLHLFMDLIVTTNPLVLKRKM